MVDTTCRCKCAGSTTACYSGANAIHQHGPCKKGQAPGDITQGTNWTYLPSSKLSGHLCQAFSEGGRLLQGVRRHCRQLRAICGMPFLVLHALGPVCFACAVGGHIEGLNLVDIVVIHAPLGEDVLPPCSELPIASVVCAGREHSVTILQILREHADCRLADDLQVHG